MGAGAGYTIETEDVKIVGDVQLNSFEKTGEDSNVMFRYDVISVDCNINIIGSIRATSYMDGCDWIKNVPMTVNNVVINVLNDGGTEISEYDIISILENTVNYVGSGVYGGGWTHVTFDGTFDIRPSDTEGYADDVSEVTITINHPNIVNFIDLAVTGDNREYDVCFNGDMITGTDNEEEAISILKDTIRTEIAENGIDSIDFYECYVKENYWTEDVDGNIDIELAGYDNVVYRAETDIDEFENFADGLTELNDEMGFGDADIGEDFDI